MLSAHLDVKWDVAKETQKNKDSTTLVWVELNTHRERQCWKQPGSNKEYSSFPKWMKINVNLEFLKISRYVKEKFKLYFNIHFLQMLSKT